MSLSNKKSSQTLDRLDKRSKVTNFFSRRKLVEVAEVAAAAQKQRLQICTRRKKLESSRAHLATTYVVKRQL